MKVGFITNDDKSHWTPRQVIEWLSIVWDTIHGTIRISGRRLSSIADSVGRMSHKRFMVSARELATFVGKFISASAVFGNISRIMTRYLVNKPLRAAGMSADNVRG